MFMNEDLSSKFNAEAAESAFYTSLENRFDRATAAQVLEVFSKMLLPPPQKEGEFLPGLDGDLVFLNEYGLVIRIEESDSRNIFKESDRVNDSAWIVRPLVSVNAGKALVEFCPGCHQEKNEATKDSLRRQLREQDIAFWDCKISNIGRIPIKTVSFPEGVPVVIDRLAVKVLTNSIASVSEALSEALHKEAMAAENALYAPLKEALNEVRPDPLKTPDPEKVKKFWALCRSYTQEGKLVAGWNEPQGEDIANENCTYGTNEKISKAAEAAGLYAARLKQEGFMSSGSSANLQSPRPPV
jgi:hypothetical protein